MIDKQFEKEAFKKSVRDNVKYTGRGYTGADLSGCKLHSKRCDH